MRVLLVRNGGEPLAQPAFLTALLAACKRREIHTVVDTTGHAPWEFLEPISRHVDLFLYDLKHMDPDVHQRVTGVSNALVLENLRRLARLGSPIVIRFPLIPGVNDDHQNVEAVGRFVAPLDGVQRIDILPYNEAARGKLARLAKTYPMMEAEPTGQDRLETMAEQLRRFGVEVKIGG